MGFYTSASSWWWRWRGCCGGGGNGFHCGFTEVAMNFLLWILCGLANKEEERGMKRETWSWKRDKEGKERNRVIYIYIYK